MSSLREQVAKAIHYNVGDGIPWDGLCKECEGTADAAIAAALDWLIDRGKEADECGCSVDCEDGTSEGIGEWLTFYKDKANQ